MFCVTTTRCWWLFHSFALNKTKTSVTGHHHCQEVTHHTRTYVDETEID